MYKMPKNSNMSKDVFETIRTKPRSKSSHTTSTASSSTSTHLTFSHVYCKLFQNG